MTTALAERPETAPAVVITNEQTALIKQTIAVGATDAELKLFFYDCTRRGVHPLDKLIHFTKRGGKYTPITSIDFMRSRAHETNECAGISDPDFTGETKKEGFAARVVVHRLVQGQMCPFAATARWEEYCPGAGQDHMWRKMPHTMLGKCAEALALRKAFPQQLQGLYAREEMDQAGGGESAPVLTADASTGEIVEAAPVREGLYVLGIDDSKRGSSARGPWTLYKINFTDGRTLSTFNESTANEALDALEKEFPVEVTAGGKNNSDLKSLKVLRRTAPEPTRAPEPVIPLDASEIPF